MATPNVNEVIKWAKSKMGQTRWNGKCQGFVADACCVGGKYNRVSSASATSAWKSWGKNTSKTGIPAGAAVYFKGTGPNGHVGLFIGNNQFIHAASGVRISNFSSYIASGGAHAYRGWGWNGNIKLAGSATGTTGSTSSGSSSSTDSEGKSEKKDITTVVVKSVTGASSSQKEILTTNEPYLTSGVEILIQNDKVYLPAIEGDVVLDRERKAGSKLSFTVMTDEIINFQEGNPVSFRYNGSPVFFGYVFSKSRSDNKKIKVTCYDQMRYLKNKDTLSYTNKTYSELLKMIADDYRLKYGTIEDTKYKIEARIEEGTLIDMLGNASDITVQNTGHLFVLYDDFGKLTLCDINNMKLDIIVDKDTAQGYDYTSTIDGETYNRIKLAMDNGDTGEREVYVLNDETNQSLWGMLQFYEKQDDGMSTETLKAKAKTLLKYYNRKQRNLRVNKVFGDIRVRGGSSVVVNLGLGDINVRNYMCVESAKHTFSHKLHVMDLTLSGIRGEFTI